MVNNCLPVLSPVIPDAWLKQKIDFDQLEMDHSRVPNVLRGHHKKILPEYFDPMLSLFLQGFLPKPHLSRRGTSQQVGRRDQMGGVGNLHDLVPGYLEQGLHGESDDQCARG